MYVRYSFKLKLTGRIWMFSTHIHHRSSSSKSLNYRLLFYRDLATHPSEQRERRYCISYFPRFLYKICSSRYILLFKADIKIHGVWWFLFESIGINKLYRQTKKLSHYHVEWWVTLNRKEQECRFRSFCALTVPRHSTPTQTQIHNSDMTL